MFSRIPWMLRELKALPLASPLPSIGGKAAALPSSESLR